MNKLQELASYLSEFERPGFEAGEWRGGDEIEPNVISMPYVAYSDIVESFIRSAYEYGWVSEFNWVDWKNSAEAIALQDDEETLRQATETQIHKLLTVCLRQDRFVEGLLLTAFESGLMVRIVQRAVVLASIAAPDGK